MIINADRDIEEEIESIFKHQRIKNKRQYLVKCFGQAVVDEIWIRTTKLMNAKELLRDYKKRLKKRTSLLKKGECHIIRYCQ